MQNSFLIESLKWLQPDDIEELGLFVYSEFHNRGNFRGEIIRLFQYLKENYPEFREADIQKEKVYEIIFPNTPRISSKLEKLMSELYKLVKEFLIWQQYQKPENSFNKALDWAKALQSLSGYEKFEAALAKIEKDFLANAPASPIQYFQRYQVDTTRQKWMNVMNRGKEDINLNKTLYSLCAFFEVQRLEYINKLLVQQKLAHFEIQDQIKKIIETDQSLVSPNDHIILSLSKKIHALLNKTVPDFEDFEALMTDLKNNETLISQDMLILYYAYLRNICTLMLNAGHENLLGVLFELLKDNLSRGYLYYNGKLHTNTLINITRTSIMAGKVDWAISCIEQHAEKMFGDIENDDYYKINMALCLFEKKEYDKVLDLLPPSLPNVAYHLIARRLELMCYYELRSDLLPHKLEAFKIYIWRASEKFLSDVLKEANKAFVNLLIQLMAIPPGDKKKRARVEGRIREKKQVAESRWLLAKVL